MADAQVAPAGGDGAQQQGPPNGGIMSMVLRMGVMYLLMTYLRGSGKPKDLTNMFKCNFEKGEAVDMQVYMSTSPNDMGTLLWEEKRLPLASWPSTLSKSINITEEVLAPITHENATAWLTTFFSRSDATSSSAPAADDAPQEAPQQQAPSSFSVQTKLVAHRPPPKVKQGKFLLGDKAATKASDPEEPEPEADTPSTTLLDDEDEPAREEPPKPWVPYWKPNMTIAVVNEFGVHPNDKLPPHFGKLGKFDHTTKTYFPIVSLNEFWLLKDHLVPLNETVKSVELHLELTTMSSWWLQMQLAVEQSFEMQQSGGMIQDGESDELKRIFIEGNPYLLAVTTVVSILHSVFDMLAFKNDIGFWKNNKSMEGLSARTIIINAVCQLIIFLYLLDNETSYVVLFSSGIGTLIEFWKVTKAMNVSVVTGPSGWPKIKFEDRGSYVVSKTKQYDDEAMRYLSIALFPLIIGYSIYSLMYSEHKSWYSWGLGSLVGCVYTFGFVLMCPQLYLNYKLKSVAHLPWRQMTYKFLNTIIDDLFAFVIKMPTLHRLSVFRDDAIFLIYIYQRWIYPVDKARVNEFGFSDAPPEEETPATGAVEGPVDGSASNEESAGASAIASKAGGRKDAAVKKVVEADTSPAPGQSSQKTKAT